MQVRDTGGEIDYLTFVPDGEPTLDKNLGIEIMMLKQLMISIAVITVDEVSQEIWRKIDRSFKSVDLTKILEGIKKFSTEFKGVLISETMLVNNIEYGGKFEKIAVYLSSLKNLKTSYISIPTRPPAEEWAKPPEEEILNEAFQIFENKLKDRVKYLIGYEGNAFAYSGNIEEDLLSITAVHPMREEAVKELLEKDRGDLSKIETLIKKCAIRKVNYQGHTYYLRKFR